MHSSVAEVAADLIRIDTSNAGDNLGPGELAAAEYVARYLIDLGLDPRITGPSKDRASVICKVPGTEPDAPGLLLHGHLDVVPANPDEWEYHPFKGEIVDGVLWGRGAVDMKGQDAIILESIARLIRGGKRPRPDITLVFTADEEAGGKFGAQWLVENEPEVFKNIKTAIGEVGGFNLTLPSGQNVFFVQVGEKGMWWTRIKFRGTPGHGSMLNPDNAVAKLGEAVARINSYDFPPKIGVTTQELINQLTTTLGMKSADDDDGAALMAHLGAMGRAVGATFKNTLTPTVVSAGEKVNVVPAEAILEVDGRYLPGEWESFESAFTELIGQDAEITTIVRDIAYEASLSDPILQNMKEAVSSQVPDAILVPYLMPGGTDGKAFTRLGISCYGFLPMLLPAGWDAMSMFHAANERVPVTALEFGVDVLSSFLEGL